MARSGGQESLFVHRHSGGKLIAHLVDFTTKEHAWAVHTLL